MKKYLLLSLIIVSLYAKQVPFEDKISGLYIAFYDRAADYDGLNYWAKEAKKISEDKALKEIAYGFASHPKFKELYGNLDDKSFVEAIYKNVLGKQGDSSGISFWLTNLLNHNMTRDQMVANFVSSALTTDINQTNITDEEKKIAQDRQDLLENKVKIANKFTNSLKDKTNLKTTDVSIMQEDKAFKASVQILKGINESKESIRKANDFLDKIVQKIDDNKTDIMEEIITKYTPPKITNEAFKKFDKYCGDLVESFEKFAISQIKFTNQDFIDFAPLDANNTILKKYINEYKDIFVKFQENSICDAGLGVLNLRVAEKNYKQTYEKLKSFDSNITKARLSDLLGREYFLKSDKDNYVDFLKKVASEGDTDAQINLAYNFYSGKYLEKDTDEAKKYAKMAADRNITYAKELLLSIDKDKKANKPKLIFQNSLAPTPEQIKQYDLLKEPNFSSKTPVANANLNPPQTNKTIEKLKKEADKNAQASYELFWRYSIQKDENQTKLYLQKAADLGLYIAKARLAYAQMTGKLEGFSYEKKLQLGAKTFRELAKDGNFYAMQMLGHMYENGYIYNQRFDQAFLWYGSMVEFGDACGYEKLGDLFRYVFYTEKAEEYYEKSIKYDCKSGYRKLGLLYSDDLYKEANYEKALEYFKQGSDLKDTKSSILAGNLYSKTDIKNACKYWQIAIDKNATSTNDDFSKNYEKHCK